MPRTTRKRTLIAQARVSEAELAEWRAKASPFVLIRPSFITTPTSTCSRVIRT